MTKYIDKSDVMAKIKNRIKELQNLHKENEEKLDSIQKTAILLCIDECKVILSFLDTLEVKEINNVWHNAKRTIPEDGKEQIICIKEDGLAVSTVGKIVNGTIKWAYLNDLLDTSSFNIETKRE
jgi:hypothetical protein